MLTRVGLQILLGVGALVADVVALGIFVRADNALPCVLFTLAVMLVIALMGLKCSGCDRRLLYGREATRSSGLACSHCGKPIWRQ
jgi:DNA-directed RNA polymerase subunit RPC12/RpoP